MRKFWFLALGSVLFLSIFLIGFFSSFKNTEFSYKNLTNFNFSKKNDNLASKGGVKNSNSLESQNPLLSSNKEVEEIKKEVNDLIKEIKPDPQKNVSSYIEELKKIQQKYSIKLTSLEKGVLNKEVVDSFFNLAQDLLKVKPPEVLYEAHLKIVRTYLSLALASQKYLQTNDDFEKVVLYNFMESRFNELKSLINE